MSLSPKFKQRCEALGIERRTKLQRRAFDPLPARVLLEDLKAQIFAPNELRHLAPDFVDQLLTLNEWSGGVVSKNPITVIYNPTHAPTRFESTMMHEIGHLLLDHPLLPFNLDGTAPRNPQHEAEASHLGGCLQIPRRALQWAVQSRYQVAEIAAHFGASQAMVRYRAKITGVTLLD